MSIGESGRRSPRVLLRVDVRVEHDGSAHNAHTVVVNRHGALMLSPVLLEDGTTLTVWNSETGESARFAVVFNGGEDLPGLHKIGIELLELRPFFWGWEYERLQHDD
jgi:hypothetical protein